MAHPQFDAVNLISDPIHGYIELTKRFDPAPGARQSRPAEESAEQDILDSAWLQRLRRISQLQSARWVFPTAEHSRFTHGLGVMHEAGLWGHALYPTLRETLLADTLAEGPASEHPVPSEALVVETLRISGLLHDVGHGPFAHFFDEQVLSRWPAPSHPSRDPDKRLSHEDLGGAIIERDLGPVISGLRRAPGPDAERSAFAEGERIDPRWISFLISKPPIADASMPLWVRRLQPLFSGVFTVDNLDYVRRDAYMTGVATGPIDADRLRRYSFFTERGLTLYEPGLGALEMFLTARLFMYNTVYFHRTVRAIDLDLAEVFEPSIRAIFGEGNPLEDLEAYVTLDEYSLLHHAARWSRGELIRDGALPGSGEVSGQVGELWRGILLRRPTWRAVREVRRDSLRSTDPSGALEAELAKGLELDGRIRLDLAETDARPQNPLHVGGQLIVARRDGRLDAQALPELLERLPAVVVVGRAYERLASG
ncbi:MAG: HD domain-containing protein [Chloroflexi bacterium]|nr:HD domain-containing protein [Chloroflexota bacterium]